MEINVHLLSPNVLWIKIKINNDGINDSLMTDFFIFPDRYLLDKSAFSFPST